MRWAAVVRLAVETASWNARPTWLAERPFPPPIHVAVSVPSWLLAVTSISTLEPGPWMRICWLTPFSSNVAFTEKPAGKTWFGLKPWAWAVALVAGSRTYRERNASRWG